MLKKLNKHLLRIKLKIYIFGLTIFLIYPNLFMFYFTQKNIYPSISTCRYTEMKEILYSKWHVLARSHRVGPCQGQRDPWLYARNTRRRTANRGARPHRGRHRRMDAADSPWEGPTVDHRPCPRCQMTGIRVCNACCAPDHLPGFCRHQTCRIDVVCWRPHHPNAHRRGPRYRYLSCRTAIAPLAYHHQDEVRRYNKANCPRACMIGIFHWVRFLKIEEDCVKSYNVFTKPDIYYNQFLF